MGTRRWWRILVVFGFLLAGCSEPEDPVWTAVAITDAGIVATLSGAGESGRSDLLSIDDGKTWSSVGPRSDVIEVQVSKLTELCLRATPNVCIRADGPRILESIDGGQTYETAWELDLRGDWLTRQLDTFWRATTFTGTMAETDSGAVVVAVGAIPPVRRAIDGEWNPSEAQLRAFPIGGTLWALAGIATLSIAFASDQTRMRLTILGCGLIYLGTLTMRLASENLILLTLGLGIVLVIGIFVTFVVLAIRNAFVDSPPPQDYTDPWWTPERVAPWALPAVLLPLTMSAWAWDLMSWDVAEILWFGGIGISLVISLIQMRRQIVQARVQAQQ